MPDCEKCRVTISNADVKRHHTKVLCEDCYIDEVMSKMPKAHYENGAEFMNRLKDSYTVRRQRYH